MTKSLSLVEIGVFVKYVGCLLLFFFLFLVVPHLSLLKSLPFYNSGLLSCIELFFSLYLLWLSITLSLMLVVFLLLILSFFVDFVFFFLVCKLLLVVFVHSTENSKLLWLLLYVLYVCVLCLCLNQQLFSCFDILKTFGCLHFVCLHIFLTLFFSFLFCVKI